MKWWWFRDVVERTFINSYRLSLNNIAVFQLTSLSISIFVTCSLWKLLLANCVIVIKLIFNWWEVRNTNYLIDIQLDLIFRQEEQQSVPVRWKTAILHNISQQLISAVIKHLALGQYWLLCQNTMDGFHVARVIAFRRKAPPPTVCLVDLQSVS